MRFNILLYSYNTSIYWLNFINNYSNIFRNFFDWFQVNKYIQNSPFTPIAYASKYTKLNWIELIFKIYLPFFAGMDPKQNAEKPFIIILTILYFSMITMRLKTR